MHSDSATASSKEDFANRIGGKRQRSTQEAALLLWLQAVAPVAAVSAPLASRARAPERHAIALSEIGKARTLRQAFAAEGLELLPDPLRRVSGSKVARLKR